MAHVDALPQINRYITSHDPEGKAVFSSLIPSACSTTLLPSNDAAFTLGYTTKGFPVSLTDDNDITSYKSYLKDAPGLTISDGTVLRYVDMSPGMLSPMHRTVSLDYGIVIEGEVELVLDSGETKLMKRGDVAVQRGTMHAWRNPSESQWARMVFVLQACKPIEVVGGKLDEDLETMQGVRTSD